jgi:OmpA-OmpF porin, OOP family
MRKSLANQKNGLSVLIALILGIITISVNAQSTRNEKEHIEVNIHDSSGKIVRSGTGECWHTHLGQPKEGECNPMPIANTIAPALIDKPIPIAPPIQIEEPVAVRELPIVSIKKITLDASEFFDFGEPILRPSARAELDDFIEKLKDSNPQTITVIGHADRIGSAHYNQILSEQRAATVKAYLVRKGVSSNIVLAEGKGDTQPITTKDQCPSDKTPKTIECLQPDRRVGIEMTGTK